MPRFGVFFVPPARSPLFRLATSIIGYDARSDKYIPVDNFIRAQLPNFDDDSVRRPRKHGIHCTITAPQHCRYGDLDAINYDIERALSCFASDTAFEMTAHTDFVTFWGKKRQIVVLQYQPNPAFLALHTLLVSQLNKYIRPNPELPQAMIPHEYHRNKHFNYPFVFDGFTPHFTLMFPYKDDQHDELQAKLYDLFSHFKQLTLESFCLMIQPDKKSQWILHKEYQRLDYPTAMD